jgi:hypothetical protein
MSNFRATISSTGGWTPQKLFKSLWASLEGVNLSVKMELLKTKLKNWLITFKTRGKFNNAKIAFFVEK